MSDTFPYYNKAKGRVEQRPTQPSFFQRAYESAAYPDDIDSKREQYNRAMAEVQKPDKGSTPQSDD